MSAIPQPPFFTYDETTQLLRALRMHRKLLEEAYQDAIRRSNGTQICYLVDYAELHRYLFGDPAQEQETFLELEYLFNCRDITFVFGYGTIEELLNHMDLMKEAPPYEWSKNPVQKAGTFADGQWAQLAKVLDKMKVEEAGFGLIRLKELLGRGNFVPIITLEQELGGPGSSIDEDAFRAASSLFNGVRPKATRSNLADALNFASVVGLRKHNQAPKQQAYFPFLLTNTHLLLDERNWGSDPEFEQMAIDVSVSVRPVMAIYSRVTSVLRPDPTSARAELGKLISRCTAAEYRLRANMPPRGSRLAVADSEWEKRLHQLDKNFVKQLQDVHEVISDPFIREFQRVYDNKNQAVRNWRTMKRQSTDEFCSPQKLFDIIADVTKALESSEALETLWPKVLECEHHQGMTFSAKTYYERGLHGEVFIRIEKHMDGHFVLSWPTRMTIERILDRFAEAYGKHGIHEVRLYVGTPQRVLGFEADLPFSASDLGEEVHDRILWIRMSSELFDLYADVVRDADTSPQITVIMNNPNRQHMLDFHSKTSARFIFPRWLRAVLADAGIPGNEG